tara:strand:- start:1090 stop:1545 length:456 start_codon:yes stop_codon:yes gene_type:complete
MNNLHYKILLKYTFLILILYNLISLFILFTPIKSLKNSLWKVTPYDYSLGMKFPYNLEKKSLLNKTNRDELTSFLNKNINRNLLNANYWNYKLIIESYDKKEKIDFEKSFMNLFILTKNNKQKNLDLKKYFVVNYNYFSNQNIKKILENYN